MGVIWSTLSGRFEDVDTVYCLHPYAPEIALYPEASRLEGTSLQCIEFEIAGLIVAAIFSFHI